MRPKVRFDQMKNNIFAIILVLLIFCFGIATCVAHWESLQVEIPTTLPHQSQCTIDQNPSSPIATSGIRLARSMDISHRAHIKLRCIYFVSQDVYHPGDIVTVLVKIENLSSSIPYVRNATDQFGAASLVLDSKEQSFIIAAEEIPYTDDTTAREFAHLEQAQRTYQFRIPQDAPEGSYVLELDLFDTHIRFDNEAAQVPKYVPCLADLPEEAQKRIARSGYGTKEYAYKALHVPVYGEFGDVYVTYYHFFGNTWITYETVNGLTFEYPSSNQIQVFTPEKEYSLSEAFDQGILSAAQVEQVYHNYQLVGTRIPTYRYGPRMELDPYMIITDWEARFRYSYRYRSQYDYEHFYPGDRVSVYVEVENIGPKRYIDGTVSDLFGSSAKLIADGTEYALVSIESDYKDLHPVNTWISGLSHGMYYEFIIPQDIQDGHYTLVANILGKEVYFDIQIAEESPYLTMLGDLTIPIQQMMFGKHFNLNSEYMDKCHSMPVYGMFKNTYVYIYDIGATDGITTYETVNGLEFVYPNGYEMIVYKEGIGALTLTQAFEQGILNAQQLQEVYDNYTYVQNHTSNTQP